MNDICGTFFEVSSATMKQASVPPRSRSSAGDMDILQFNYYLILILYLYIYIFRITHLIINNSAAVSPYSIYAPVIMKKQSK